MREDYGCIYASFDVREATGEGKILSTMHRIPSDGNASSEDYIKVWACVQRSLLLHIGYSNLDALSDEELVSVVEPGKRFEPSELHAWLVRVVLENEVELDGVPKTVARDSMKRHLDEVCQ